MKKLLFVCTANMHRSPTAESIFRNVPGVETKSAGTDENSEVPLNRQLLEWADFVFVMEEKHREHIEKTFHKVNKRIIVLNIPDVYNYMGEDLVKELKQKMHQFFS